MMYQIKHFFGFSAEKKPTTEFSEFFTNASAQEKKRVLTEVVRKANEDQRAVLERHRKMFKTKTT